MYGKEASNRKQEIDRQHHTIPNQRDQRPKDKHCGNVHNRLWNPPTYICHKKSKLVKLYQEFYGILKWEVK